MTEQVSNRHRAQGFTHESIEPVSVSTNLSAYAAPSACQHLRSHPLMSSKFSPALPLAPSTSMLEHSLSLDVPACGVLKRRQAPEAIRRGG